MRGHSPLCEGFKNLKAKRLRRPPAERLFEGSSPSPRFFSKYLIKKLTKWG